MNKVYMRLLMGLLMLTGTIGSLAQSTANYLPTPTTVTTGTNGSLALDMNGNTIDMTTGTTSLIGASIDDGASSLTNLNLGAGSVFEFFFMGTRYTNFGVSSNGILTMGATPVTTVYAIPNSTVPTISAFANDMQTGTNGNVIAKVVGTAPNRCLVLQWTNIMIRYNLGANEVGTGTWQVRLYETTGAIEYVFGAMTTNAASPAAYYVGFSVNTTANNVVTLNTNTNAANTTATVTSNTYTASSTITDLNSAANGSRKYYRFTPPVPAAPTAPLTFTGVTSTGMTANWTAASPITNVLKYAVYYSSDGGATYTFANTVNVGTNILAITGLLPSTTYTVKVVSVSEGGVSTATTGTQATAAPATYYWVGTSGGTWGTAANWNTNPAGGGSTRSTASTTDILIVDGAGTTAGAATTISVDVASFSIGQFKVTSNTACTLQSSAATTRIITITGATGDDYVIEAGSSLILNNATNAVAFAFSGTGNTGDISGTLTLGGSTSNVVTTTGGTGTVVTVSSTGVVNLTAVSSTAVLAGSAATLTFANGSNCNVSGYTTSNAFIPTATWGASSNITLTGGTTGTGISTSSTSFGNFTYNSTTQTATFSAFTTSTITIQGNLTIQATNTGLFRTLTSGTLNILGNLVMTAGTFQVSSSTGTINVSGNVTVNGGSFDIAQGGASNLKVAGNFIQNAGTILQTSTTGTLEFNGTSAQTLTLVPGSHGTNAINARINNTAGVNLTSAFSIRNLTVSKGNLTGAGSLTYNGTTSLLTYNSTTGVQTATAVEFPSTGGPSSLTINNTFTAPNNTVTIPFSRTLAGTSGTLTLTAGMLDNLGFVLSLLNTATTAISGGSATIYVKGAIERNLPASLVTGSTYTWPVGKGTYNPFFLVNPTTNAGGTVTVRAETFDANAGGTPGTNMGTLNTDRYWAASVTSGGANFTNTFIRLNDASVVATSAIASSTTQSGTYDIVGSTNPVIVVGTSVTSATTASTTIPGFYVIGIKAVPMVYTSSTTTQAVTSAVIKPATNQQIIGVQIVTTGNASPLTLTGMDFNTTGCTAPAADIANARVWYTGTSSTFATTTQFGSDVPTPSGIYTVTGSLALAEGINYFWLVYDVPAGATVNNILDAECTSVNVGSAQTPSVTAPAGTRVIKAALAGTYLVGASQSAPNYSKLTDAITDLNAYGVSAPVVFELQNDYSSATETFPLSINVISGGSATNTLTIRPGSGVTAAISGALASAALIKLNGADYVTIDGSNSGGTDKSLTITNTATTAPTGVSIVSLGTGAGATNNTIKNCNISTGVQTSTGYGISVGGATPGNTGADNDNVTIQNNNISACVVGIYAQGTATVSAGGDDNLNITGNTVTYNSNLGANIGITVNNSLSATISQNNISITTTVTSGSCYGMQVGGTTGATVSQNTISVSTAASTAPVGISLETGFVSSSVTKNLISGVTTSNTGGYGGRGITIGTGTASSNLTLSNNIIYGVNGSNWTGFTNSSSMGIVIGTVGNSSTLTTTAGGVNLYFNSVNLYGNHSFTSATVTTALYVGSGASALDIRNNIFANSLNNTSTSGSKNYCIYSAAANTAFTTINYNDYYPVTSANSTGLVGFLGSDQATIAAWRTASAQDVQSISNDPKFLSNTNLHINTAVVTPVESAGVTIAAVTDDYDGDVRSGTPDIGADEGTFIAPAANDMAATAFINPTNAGSKTVAVAFTPQASFTNSGSAAQTNVPVRFRIVDAGLVEIYNQTGTIASIGSSATTTVTFPSVTINTVGTYTMYAKAELVGDAISANDEITGTFTVTDPYTSSTTTQNTSSVGLNTTNQQVIGMQVVVSGTSATATSFTFNTNGTTAPATDITNAKIYYTGTTSTFSATGQFGATVASPNGSHTVTGTQALANGTNYFWITYDIPSGATVSNLVDAEFTSVIVNGITHTPTVTAPAGSRTIVGPMSGTYLVGAGQTPPNFTNLTNAIADLAIRGVSGATVFELQSTYSSATETFPLTINAFAGASASNTLTIKPGAGVTANISGSSTVAIVKLNGADYVTIDGSNSGTSSRDLTVTNASTGPVIWLGTDATSGANNNTFKNANMAGPGASTGQGILAGSGTTAGNAAETGRPNSNNTIQNLTAKSVQNAVYIAGDATTPDQNWLITQNSFGSTVAAEKLSYRGIAISSAQNFTISQNTIFGVVSSTGSSSTMSGISVFGTMNGGTISGNKISDIKQVNTTGWGSNGIYLGAASTASNISVYNNFVSDVASYGYGGGAGASDNGYGIIVDAGGGYKIYHNTVVLTTNQTLTTSLPSAMNITSTAVTAGSIDLRDNIFVNNQTIGVRYAIYSTASNTVFSNIDYNDYAVASGGTIGYIGSNRATIAAIQTGFGGNTNSLNITPVFVNALTDFHLTSANTGLKAGTPVAGVTLDYDAQTRNITVPAIGADEIYLPNFWAGNTSTDWNTTTNWDDATVPSGGANIKVPAGVPNMPALAAATTVGNLSLGTGTTLNLAGTNLTINGAVSGAGTFTGSASSNLTIGGAAGTLNFNQTSAATRSLNNLTMNGTSATLGSALDIYGVLDVTTGTLDLNAKAVTLKSISNAATARVAPIAGTLNGASNVTVERYIADPGHRAWHLLSGKAVTGSQTIYQAWQENGATGVSLPGYGTWITSNLYTGSNGFDASSNSASVLTHDQTIPAWEYNLANTNTALSAKQGYMLFVRGDRNYTPTLPSPTASGATTLRTNGTLTQGNQSVSVSATGTGRTLVGNPYASPIDFEAISGTSNLDQNFYIWDPTMTGNYGVGGFRLVERVGVNSYQATPSINPTDDNTLRYLHSGEAFFLKATGSDATVQFTEATKAVPVGVVNPIVNGANDPQLYTNLLIVNPGNQASLADGLRVRFNDNYTAATSDDVLKMGNFAENISSYREGKKLIVEKRPLVTTRDTVFLRMSNTGIREYRLAIGTINFNQPGMIAYLEDAYTNSRTPLNMAGTENIVDFSVTADAGSANPDRFRIVFAAAGPLPVTITKISAAQQGNNVTVDWKVSNQLNMKQYEVERSADGVNFTKMATQAAVGTNGSDAAYNWIDVNPFMGDNYYRVRGVAISGDVKLSDIVRVRMTKGNPAITVYPNPVMNRNIGILFTDMPKGVYQLRLISVTGQVAFAAQVTHTGGSATQPLNLGRNFVKGQYQLEIINPDKSKTVRSLLVAE